MAIWPFLLHSWGSHDKTKMPFKELALLNLLTSPSFYSNVLLI